MEFQIVQKVWQVWVSKPACKSPSHPWQLKFNLYFSSDSWTRNSTSLTISPVFSGNTEKSFLFPKMLLCCYRIFLLPQCVLSNLCTLANVLFPHWFTHTAQAFGSEGNKSRIKILWFLLSFFSNLGFSYVNIFCHPNVDSHLFSLSSLLQSQLQWG
jgi:hypothetical protein